MIKYKTTAQKCIEANANAYKRKPVYKRARQVKREMIEEQKAASKNIFWANQIDFRML